MNQADRRGRTGGWGGVGDDDKTGTGIEDTDVAQTRPGRTAQGHNDTAPWQNEPMPLVMFHMILMWCV